MKRLLFNSRLRTLSRAVSASSDPEYRTVREVLSGDRELFRELIGAHKAGVLNLVFRQVGDADLAEELTQEIFIKAYVNLSQFRFESSFGTWVTRIALNHTNSYFGSREFKEAQASRSFEPELHDCAPDSEDNEKRRDLVERFREALSELKPVFREVVVLCAIEGKSYEQAAAILDIPLGTVRSRLSKARVALRKVFESYE